MKYRKPPREEQVRAFIERLGPDFTRRDTAYWRELFRSIHRSFGLSKAAFAQDIVGAIKQRRYYHRRTPKGTWETRYPRVVVSLLRAEFHKLEADVADPCRDNYRVANLSKRRERNRYAAQQAKGCCGAVDRIVRIGSGPSSIFKIGFNFGH